MTAAVWVAVLATTRRSVVEWAIDGDRQNCCCQILTLSQSVNARDPTDHTDLWTSQQYIAMVQKGGSRE